MITAHRGSSEWAGGVGIHVAAAQMQDESEAAPPELQWELTNGMPACVERVARCGLFDNSSKLPTAEAGKNQAPQKLPARE